MEDEQGKKASEHGVGWNDRRVELEREVCKERGEGRMIRDGMGRKVEMIVEELVRRGNG